MLSDEWLSRYGLLENFNASVTRTGTGTWTTGVTAIALCTSCSRAKNLSNADANACAGVTAIALPVLLYRRAKKPFLKVS